MERIQDDGMEHAADPDLVRDAKRGDEAAFTSLLRPLLEPAYRLAAGMLQDRQLAEDAVQEAAVKAWRKIHQLREGTEMRPWFLGVVGDVVTRAGPWIGARCMDKTTAPTVRMPSTTATCPMATRGRRRDIGRSRWTIPGSSSGVGPETESSAWWTSFRSASSWFTLGPP